MYSFNWLSALARNSFNPRCNWLFTVASGISSNSEISIGSRSSWYRKIITMRGPSASVAINLRSVSPSIGSPGDAATAGSAAELAQKHPLVQQAMRLFSAEISNVIDLRGKE